MANSADDEASGEEVNERRDGGSVSQRTNAPPESMGQQSYVDMLDEEITQSYVKFCAVLYGVIGAGMGILLFVLDIFSISPVVITWEGYSSSQGTVVEQTQPLPLISGEFLYPLLIVISVGLTAFLAVQISQDDLLSDREAPFVAAVATGAGSALHLIIGGFLGSEKPRYVEILQSNSGTSGDSLTQLYTIKPLNLILNAILIGIVVGIIGAVVVFVFRNYAPNRTLSNEAIDR